MRVFAIAAWSLVFAATEHVGLADEPVRVNWSGATQSYEFDTGQLFGCIDPYSHYHGVVGLMHREYQVDVVRPRKAFLNAEYYRKPNTERRMLPRQLSLARKTTHELRQGEVIVRFPEEPVYGFAMKLSYRPHGDALDMRVELLPSRDVPQFEIFFASYVCEAFSETWTPLGDESGKQEWKKLDNREVINEVFSVLRRAGGAGGTAWQPFGQRSTSRGSSQDGESPVWQADSCRAQPERWFGRGISLRPERDHILGRTVSRLGHGSRLVVWSRSGGRAADDGFGADDLSSLSGPSFNVCRGGKRVVRFC